jgi:hypothetical protein
MSTSTTTKLWPFHYVFLGVVMAFFIAMWSGGKSTLVCSRGSGQSEQCEVKDFGLFGTDRSLTIPLKDIKKVDVIADSNDEDAAAILVLVTNNEQVAIGTSGEYQEKDRLASQVAWFLEDPKATAFDLTDGNQTFAWCLLGLSLAIFSNYLYQLIKSFKSRSA